MKMMLVKWLCLSTWWTQMGNRSQ